jgi:hypothetical protein
MYQTEARRHGQDIATTTDDTTFAGGLRHITSVLPSLMNDILQHAPDNQKVINFKPPSWGEDKSRRNTNHIIKTTQKFIQIDYWMCFSFFPSSFFTFCGQRKLSGPLLGENKEAVRHLDTIEDIPRRNYRRIPTKIRNRVNDANWDTSATSAPTACQKW